MKKSLIYEILAAVVSVALFFIVLFGSSFFTNWNVKTWFKVSAAEQEQPKVEVPFGILQNTSTFTTTQLDYVSLVETYGKGEVITEDKTFGNITISGNSFFGENEFGLYYVQCNSITFTVTGDLNTLFCGVSSVCDNYANLKLLQYDTDLNVVKTHNLGYLNSGSYYYADESMHECLGRLSAGTYSITADYPLKITDFSIEEMFGVEINEDGI